MHVFCCKFISPGLELFRQSIKSFSHCCCYIGEGVAVTAKANRCTNYIFKISSFKKSRNCLWHCFLAALNMMIVRTNLVAGAAQVITKLFDYVILYLSLEITVTGHPDNACCCLGPLHSFRMIMSNFGRPAGNLARPLKRIKKPSHRAHPHSRTIAPAVIRLCLFHRKPAVKSSTISCMRILVPPELHAGYHRCLHRVFIRIEPCL